MFDYSETCTWLAIESCIASWFDAQCFSTDIKVILTNLLWELWCYTNNLKNLDPTVHSEMFLVWRHLWALINITMSEKFVLNP